MREVYPTHSRFGAAEPYRSVVLEVISIRRFLECVVRNVGDSVRVVSTKPFAIGSGFGFIGDLSGFYSHPMLKMGGTKSEPRMPR